MVVTWCAFLFYNPDLNRNQGGHCFVERNSDSKERAQATENNKDLIDVTKGFMLVTAFKFGYLIYIGSVPFIEAI